LQVTVRVTKAVHRDALTVPRAAVIQQGNSGTIYTIDTSSGHAVAKRTNVQLGLQTSDDVEISGAGLHAGMPIVLSQTDNLHDGATLSVPSPSPAPSSH
jgi:multidrug efflux pump subunit AcrA (membrane-fusion protein)